ncbi:MAG: hypothetical protein GY752_08345 [bacterium]|nr:hypothetical protein [bacterium]MCP4798954.1 hypothetical protein [bacterium]
MGKQVIKPIFVLCICFLLLPAFGVLAHDHMLTEKTETVDQIANSVKELKLGIGPYTIGEYLTAEQVELAYNNLVADSYAGTKKFYVDDYFVIVDEESNLTLAIYKQQEDVRADEVKKMVGFLMDKFDEPTTMAHEKIIYWAFGPAGVISTQTYDDSKDTGELDILATVKFSSSLEVSPGMSNETVEETASIYFIITSDLLLQKFIEQ